MAEIEKTAGAKRILQLQQPPVNEAPDCFERNVRVRIVPLCYMQFQPFNTTTGNSHAGLLFKRQ